MKMLLAAAVSVTVIYWLFFAGPELSMLAKPRPKLAAFAAAPLHTPSPKLYFHSALDAPASDTAHRTGTSYFSTEAQSRFGSGSALDTHASLEEAAPTPR